MKKMNVLKHMTLLTLFIAVFYVSNVFAKAGFTYDQGVYVKCGDAILPSGVIYIVQNVVNLIKIAIPILLIVLGMIDFMKAVMSNDEKQMKASQGKLIKRILAGVIVFFVIAIVQFVFGFVVDGDSSKNAVSCLACFVTSDDNCTFTNNDFNDGVLDDKTNGSTTNGNNSNSDSDDGTISDKMIPIDTSTSCKLNYEFTPATLKNTTLAIKLTSDCGFSVESKSCSYEDENGGNIISGVCPLEESGKGNKSITYKTGANFDTVDINIKVQFDNGEETSIRFNGGPYSMLSGEITQ